VIIADKTFPYDLMTCPQCGGSKSSCRTVLAFAVFIADSSHCPVQQQTIPLAHRLHLIPQEVVTHWTACGFVTFLFFC